MKKQTLRMIVALIALTLVTAACNLPVGPSAADPTVPPAVEPTLPQDVPATAEPTVAPTEAPTVPAGTLVSANGVSFYYDPSLASGVTATVQPDVPYSDDLPSWEVTSEQAVFTFDGYVIGDHLHTATIRVFNMNDYLSHFDSESLVDEASSLMSLIASKDVNYLGTVSIFPGWPAMELMSSNFSYLDFNGGSGVRFLAEHGQAVLPICNHDIAYIYEGFTTDGNWYIQAVFPINSSVLQADDTQIPGGDYDSFVEMSNYQNYITGIRQQLEAQPDSSFTPSLELLDALVQSITINK